MGTDDVANGGSKEAANNVVLTFLIRGLDLDRDTQDRISDAIRAAVISDLLGQTPELSLALKGTPPTARTRSVLGGTATTLGLVIQNAGENE